MIPPSGVRFICRIDCLDEPRLANCGPISGGYGEGMEDVDVLAAILRRPRGSFRFELDIRRTDPL